MATPPRDQITQDGLYRPWSRSLSMLLAVVVPESLSTPCGQTAPGWHSLL